jgi:hypothetical protein
MENICEDQKSLQTRWENSAILLVEIFTFLGKNNFFLEKNTNVFGKKTQTFLEKKTQTFFGKKTQTFFWKKAQT